MFSSSSLRVSNCSNRLSAEILQPSGSLQQEALLWKTKPTSIASIRKFNISVALITDGTALTPALIFQCRR